MNRLTILLFVMKCFSCSAKVKVSLQPYPVRYGNVLKLVCSSGQYHQDWHWFKNNALLFRNNRPSYDIDVHKYTEETIDDYHRQLTIHDFEFVDIGQYYCSNGIFEDFIDLSQEYGNLIYCENSTKTEVRQQKQKFGIGISAGVSNVSPAPVCQLVVENNTFPVNIFKTIRKEAIVDVIFQTTVFNTSFFCKKPGNPFMFVCNISGIVLGKKVSKICSDFPNRKDEKSFPEYITTTLVIISGIITLIFCVAVFYLLRRSPEPLQTKKDESKGTVGDPLVADSEV